MRNGNTRRIVAVVTSLAMILTGANLSEMNAQAASKKGSVKLNKTSVSLKVKKTVKLKLVKKKIKKIKSQKWSSKNKKIAAVTKQGKVTAKKKGTTKVICKVKYVAKGSKKTVSKTLKCTVKVTGGSNETTPTATAATTAAVSSKPTTGAAVTTTAPQQPTQPAQPADSNTPGSSDIPAVTDEPAPTGDQTPAPIPGLIEGVLQAEDITLRIPYKSVEDSSNVGEERTVSIVGGTTESMVVRDNGSVRPEISATEIVRDEMGPGINLGNTMEAVPSAQERLDFTEVSQFEKAWGAQTVTKEYIDVLKTYGINTLRIPVAWSNMIDDSDPNYTIPEKYLGRVEELVNYALNNGMYVIINDHWDGQWWGQFGACKKDPDAGTYQENDTTYAYQLKDAEGNVVADEERRAEAWKRYESFWTQISERFGGYSDHLIFEGANEELGDRLNDGICSNGYAVSTDKNDYPVRGNLTKEECYKLANQINQKFVDIVRGSAEKEGQENNKYRFLLIPGYNTDIDHTTDSKFQMPKDIDENGKKKLFVSVHFYQPNGFCLDQGGGIYLERNRTANIKTIGKLQRFKDEGYAIIIGECGVCRPTTVRGSVSQWFNDSFTEFRKYDAVPVLWDTGAYFDRTKAKMKFHDIAVFYNTITQSNGDTSMTKETGLPKEGETGVEVVDVTGMTPAWSWTGKWYKNDGKNTIGDNKFEEGGGSTGGVGEFVVDSKSEATIDGDATEIAFNDWGYQAFLKLDITKYKNPAVAFTFLDGTDNLDNVGSFSGCVTEDANFTGDAISIDYDKHHGKAITLSGQFELTEGMPWFAFTFGNAPIVTGIYVYEMGE